MSNLTLEQQLLLSSEKTFIEWTTEMNEMLDDYNLYSWEITSDDLSEIWDNVLSSYFCNIDYLIAFAFINFSSQDIFDEQENDNVFTGVWRVLENEYNEIYKYDKKINKFVKKENN